MPTAQTTKIKKTPKPLLSPGHRACAGCGQAMVAKIVVDSLGPNTIIANATGCLEVITTPYPESSWGLPWIHSLFENPAAIASGILAALDYKSRVSAKGGSASGGKVVAQGGDGATFDIGFGLISGMWERGDNILYICYDNEAYSNTGMQASGATPLGSSTTTTPPGAPSTLAAIGAHQYKKDMIAIALAHGLPYVAQSTAGFIYDIQAKVKKALTVTGPAYLQILVPCVPGWRIKPDQAIMVGKLAAQTGLYPLLEYVNGQPTGAFKAPKPAPRVEEYLKLQGRFAHLFKSDEGKKQLAVIQQMADKNIRKYGL
ncbi:MAG: thiamine pyrophosphate-dependent enzyme [Planctomycetes bacterium]|nr:thiamine pyrophosphate-dependent enzyme [Planctomycetota bacterium]